MNYNRDDGQQRGWRHRPDYDPADPFKAMTRHYDERVTRGGGRSLFEPRRRTLTLPVRRPDPISK